MKSIGRVLVVAIISLTFSNTQAQIQAGLVGGINISYLSQKLDGKTLNPKSYLDKIGIHLGISLTNSLSDALDLEMGLVYNQKGARYNPDLVIGSGQLNLHYLSLPIMAKLHPFDFPLSILAGLEISQLIGINDVRSEFDWDNIELGLRYGLAFNLTEYLAISANMTHGLQSLLSITYTDDNGQYLGTVNHKNQNFQVSLQYILN